jgi:hypothetical protein
VRRGLKKNTSKTLDKAKIKAATREAEKRNKKQINQRRIDAIKAVRERKKEIIGEGMEMIAMPTSNPDKIVKANKDLNLILELEGSPLDPEIVSKADKPLKKRAAVMEIMGDLGSPSEVVVTDRRPYLVQEKAIPDVDEYDAIDSAMVKSPDQITKKDKEYYKSRDKIIKKGTKSGLSIYDVHGENIGTRDGKKVLIDAGYVDPKNKKVMKELETIGNKLRIKKSTAGKIRRTLPVWVLAYMAANPEQAEAMMEKIPEEAYPILEAMDKVDPANIQEMGSDASVEDPTSVEFQKRMAAERLLRTIKARRNK